MRVDDEQNATIWEKTWNVEAGGLSRKLGLTTTEILGQVYEGGIRSLYIMGENPMMSEPNLNETRRHMEQLEFLVAQDIFITESAAFADVFYEIQLRRCGPFSFVSKIVARLNHHIIAIKPWMKIGPGRVVDICRTGGHLHLETVGFLQNCANQLRGVRPIVIAETINN
jgi:hypothetical protein